jgi:hypothetical protein
MTKHIMPLSLVSLLATCQPSYAIAPHYQPQNNDSFNYVDVVAVNGNNEVLSKSNSVTPQRHCGFFAPVICLASQARYKYGVSAAASHPRLQSVYDGTTRPNKPMANKSGGSTRPRVNPVTHLASQAKSVNTQKLVGVAHHG